MNRYKEEMLELYDIRLALSPYGYAVTSVTRQLGGSGAAIDAVLCRPGQHDETTLLERDLLLSMPDDVSEDAFAGARHALFRARRDAGEIS